MYKRTDRSKNQRRGYAKPRANAMEREMVRTVTVPSCFTAVAVYSASSSAQYFTLLQSAGTTIPRLVDMMNDYQFYKITQLKVTLMPTGISGTNFAIGYESSVTNTAPTTATFVDVTQLGINRLMTGSTTSPVSMLVPSTQLAAHPDKWLTTQLTVVGTLQNQGYVILVPNSTVTGTVYVKFEVVVKFKSPVVSYSVLEEKERVKRKMMLLERDNQIPKFSLPCEIDGTVNKSSTIVNVNK